MKESEGNRETNEANNDRFEIDLKGQNSWKQTHTAGPSLGIEAWLVL